MIISSVFFENNQPLFIGSSRTTSYVIIEELLKRGYEVDMPYWPRRIIKFTDNHGRTRTIKGITCWNTPALAHIMSGDKRITLDIARKSDLPLLDSELYKSPQQAKEFWLRHDGLCILKTTTGAGGHGVWTTFASLSDYVSRAAEYSVDNTLILQVKSFSTCDLRMLYIGGKFIAATTRRPAFLVGNGVDSIQELLKIENKKRLKFNLLHHSTMPKTIMSINDAVARSGRLASEVLSNGYVLQVSLANISDGGIAEDVTDLVHNDFKKAGGQICSAMPYPVLAVDFLCNDPTVSFKKNGEEVIFLETNTKPGIDLHKYPHSGVGRNTAGSFIDYVLNDNVK